METEDLVLNNCSQWKHVEEVGIVLPDVGVAVLAEALVIEAVDLRDLSALVISPNQRNAIGIANLWRSAVIQSRWSVRSGLLNRTLRASKSKNVSTEKYPRSTKSPINR